MAIVLSQTNVVIPEEGGLTVFTPVAWANAAHIVNVYAIWVAPVDSRAGKVPFMYMTQLDAFSVGGESTQYEYERVESVGIACVLRVLRNNGTNRFLVYRRRNGIQGEATIRIRQINFSVS